MANKTSNLYARIEPEVKVCAESILDTLGIPVSTAINMFYKQIILNNGLPFQPQLPYRQPINLSTIGEYQFNAVLEKSYNSMLDGEGTDVSTAFDSIKKKGKL